MVYLKGTHLFLFVPLSTTGTTNQGTSQPKNNSYFPSRGGKFWKKGLGVRKNPQKAKLRDISKPHVDFRKTCFLAKISIIFSFGNKIYYPKSRDPQKKKQAISYLKILLGLLKLLPIVCAIWESYFPLRAKGPPTNKPHKNIVAKCPLGGKTCSLKFWKICGELI